MAQFEVGCRWVPELSVLQWTGIVAGLIGGGIAYAAMDRLAVRHAWMLAGGRRRLVLLAPHILVYPCVTAVAIASATRLTNPWVTTWEQFVSGVAGPLAVYLMVGPRRPAAKLYARVSPSRTLEATIRTYFRYYGSLPPEQDLRVACDGNTVLVEGPIDAAEAGTASDLIRLHFPRLASVTVRSTLTAKPGAGDLLRPSGYEHHRLETAEGRTRRLVRAIAGVTIASVVTMVAVVARFHNLAILTEDDIRGAFEGMARRTVGIDWGLPSEVTSWRIDFIRSADECPSLLRDAGERWLTTFETLGIIDRMSIPILRSSESGRRTSY
mgnify:CR=1 FL=1